MMRIMRMRRVLLAVVVAAVLGLACTNLAAALGLLSSTGVPTTADSVRPLSTANVGGHAAHGEPSAWAHGTGGSASLSLAAVDPALLPATGHDGHTLHTARLASPLRI